MRKREIAGALFGALLMFAAPAAAHAFPRETCAPGTNGTSVPNPDGTVGCRQTNSR